MLCTMVSASHAFSASCKLMTCRTGVSSIRPWKEASNWHACLASYWASAQDACCFAVDGLQRAEDWQGPIQVALLHFSIGGKWWGSLNIPHTFLFPSGAHLLQWMGSRCKETGRVFPPLPATLGFLAMQEGKVLCASSSL